MKTKSDVVKRSISFSTLVAKWADDLADGKGFGTNFSAYIADLIRRDKEREDALKLTLLGNAAEINSPKSNLAVDQIVDAVTKAAQKQRISRLKK
jgi:hypothetical protein